MLEKLDHAVASIHIHRAWKTYLLQNGTGTAWPCVLDTTAVYLHITSTDYTIQIEDSSWIF